MISDDIKNNLPPRALDQLSLNLLPMGKTAMVTAIHLQGAERRRMLDLGIVRGVSITPEIKSMLGEPRAYRVKGSLIALRSNQSQHIMVQP